ncbi:siderophore-iron reductase FhuF [Litchfieldella rifensis]|uniref:Siderophore-iron reductase FhuF n=1 Tax=Litchfieldella rifensis TaxID=762643 RepID=A0ABV7LRG5_9GAMM
MITALSRLYVGPLEALIPPLLSTVPAQAMPAADLLIPQRLEELLDRFAVQYRQGDRRAVASLWSKWHFSALLTPALAANLLLERDLPLALERVQVILTAEGRTERLCLEHEGTPLPALGAFTRFATLLDRHLAPLIEVLSALSGASPRVFWSNAGNVFEHFVSVVDQHPMASPGTAEEARLLLESRHYPDGRRNPLFRPVRYIESPHNEVQRVRKLCCLRYLLPELTYCGNCPLEGCDGRVRA